MKLELGAYKSIAVLLTAAVGIGHQDSCRSVFHCLLEKIREYQHCLTFSHIGNHQTLPKLHKKLLHAGFLGLIHIDPDSFHAKTTGKYACPPVHSSTVKL